MSSAGEPGLLREQVVRAAADRHLALGGVGLALLVEGHHDHAGAVVADAPRLLQEGLLALLEADRVDHALALDALEPGLQHAPPRAVDHDRDAGDLRLGRDQVQERGHGPLAVEQVGVHVDVEQVGPAAYLLQRDVDGGLVVVALDQAPEPRRAGDVGALADHDEPGVRADLEGLQAAEAGARATVPGTVRGGEACRGGRDLRDVLRRRPAAPADDVDQPGLGELAEQPPGLLRRLVIAAERVRQAGVGVAGGVRAGEPRQLGEVRAHLLGAQRAVHADDQRVGVLDRVPERLDGLARQRTPAQVDDRHRDPQRQVRGDLARGGDRGLRVERVEDRLDQQQVDAAVGQRLDLLGVRGADLVERHRPVRRVLHPGGQRQRDVQRPDRAGDEAPARLVRGLARQLGAAQVHLPYEGLQPVVGLADARRGERVRRGDVRARRQVLPVHVEDDVRPRQVQQVRVAGHVARVVLEPVAAVVGRGEPGALQHRAPGSVEHHDPSVQKLPQGLLVAVVG